MTQLPDHYAALGISPQADQDVIAAAYRALLKKYHPDTGTLRGTASKEKLAAVLDAFEVLGNAESRAAYDAERATQLAAPEDDEEPMALESSSPASWNPTLGPAGERPASGPPPRRGAAWIWMLLPVLLAGSAAAWLLTAEDVEPPPPPAVTVAPPPAETAPPAAPVVQARSLSLRLSPRKNHLRLPSRRNHLRHRPRRCRPRTASSNGGSPGPPIAGAQASRASARRGRCRRTRASVQAFGLHSGDGRRRHRDRVPGQHLLQYPRFLRKLCRTGSGTPSQRRPQPDGYGPQHLARVPSGAEVGRRAARLTSWQAAARPESSRRR